MAGRRNASHPRQSAWKDCINRFVESVSYRLELIYARVDPTELDESGDLHDIGEKDGAELSSVLQQLCQLTKDRYPEKEPIARVTYRNELYQFRSSGGELYFFDPSDPNVQNVRVAPEGVPEFIRERAGEEVADAGSQEDEPDFRPVVKRSKRRAFILLVLLVLLIASVTRMVFYFQEEPSLIETPPAEVINDPAELQRMIAAYQGCFLTEVADGGFVLVMGEDGYCTYYELIAVDPEDPFVWSPWFDGSIQLARVENEKAFLVDQRIPIIIQPSGLLTVFGETLHRADRSESELRSLKPAAVD